MKIAAEHRRRGDSVVFTKHVERSMFEPTYDRVYGSAIFAYDHSLARVATLKREFPNAVVGGTHNLANPVTVEAVLGIEETAPLDYSIYPAFDASIGFTQRGCRLKCGLCVVPKKEGKNRSAATIADIWRGAPYPKHLHLLDNNFFGQPRDQWEARIDEIQAGGFRVCLNQGIDVRLIDDASAKTLASIRYTDDSFTWRRLYTAWDSLGDEELFFDGVATSERYGCPRVTSWRRCDRLRPAGDLGARTVSLQNDGGAGNPAVSDGLSRPPSQAAAWRRLTAPRAPDSGRFPTMGGAAG